MWVPSPSYLLRRWTVLRELRQIPRGRLLEIGCGAGDLLAQLVEAGFDGACVEISAEARAEARDRLRALDRSVRVTEDLNDCDGYFDLIVACEVLEHVEHDGPALREWASRLAPGGRLLLTVPAHPRRFGPSDEWAGHHRRYDRGDLEAKTRAAGLDVERLICYGFPLGNIVEPVRNLINRFRMRSMSDLTRSDRSCRSGWQRTVERRIRWLSKPSLLLPFCWMQIPFFHKELGPGYLMIARRPPAEHLVADTPGEAGVA